MTDNELREQAALLLPGWTRKALEVRQPPQETAEPFIWISPTGVSCILGPELTWTTAGALLEIGADTDGVYVDIALKDGHSGIDVYTARYEPPTYGYRLRFEPITARNVIEACVMALGGKGD